MFFLQAQDFKCEDIVNTTTTEVLFQGKWLIRKISFAKHLRDKAIATCREHLDAGKLCILVESKADLTIWIQKPEQESDKLLKSRSSSVFKSKIEDHKANPSTDLVQPSVEATTLVDLEPEFIELCRQELIEYIIKPIAERLLSKILKQDSQITPQELIELLTSQISNSRQAENFKKSLLSYLNKRNLLK